MMGFFLPTLLAALGTGLMLSSPQAALRRIETESLPQRWHRLIGNAPDRKIMLIGLALGLAVAGVVGDVLGLIAGIAAGIATIGVLSRNKEPANLQSLRLELPETLEFLAVCIEAGLPINQAVTTVAEISPPATQTVLAEVTSRHRIGLVGPVAWHPLQNHPVWGTVALDVARTERSGTSLTSTLRLHAADARQERRDAATQRARSVAVKSVVPLMTCFLPAFVLVGVVPIIIGLLHNFFG